jgi:hypothetical protein
MQKMLDDVFTIPTPCADCLFRPERLQGAGAERSRPPKQRSAAVIAANYGEVHQRMPSDNGVLKHLKGGTLSSGRKGVGLIEFTAS